MAPHKQLTKEELEQKQKEALEAAPAPEEEKEEEVVVPSEAEPSKPAEEEPQAEPTPPAEEEPADEEAEPSKPVEPQAEPSKELYKKKFSESSKEAQKLHAGKRVLIQAIADTDEIPEPTEEELSTEIGSDKWDVMSDVERELFKETVISRRWRARVKEAQDQAKKIEKWNESVSEFINDPEVLTANPDLENKQEDFIAYATQDENNNVPFKLLVGAFLHEQGKKKVENKGSQFPTGSGGPNDKGTPKSDKLTAEEGRRLRETDYPKWVELLKQGKIETDKVE